MFEQSKETKFQVTKVQQQPSYAEAIGPALTKALQSKGYEVLTPVQQQVLDPKVSGRDLRISSQTGSGKTLAIGFALRATVESLPDAGGSAEPKSTEKHRSRPQSAKPRAIVIVPTRELARQVQLELAWLYATTEVRVAVVAGGANYRDEHRALSRAPRIVVGTPGRLLDHLKQKAIDTSSVGAVVLDEADQMLDLGFREELESILSLMPQERQTHLVSATFARDVTALADRVQKKALRVEGTPLGSANTDIDHVIHVVEPRQRVDALVNVLLQHPEDQTLVFARTRAGVSEIACELQAVGFRAGSLSGDLDQSARNRALGAFKKGQLSVLVATDVAARGIDVQDIARVVQVDAPPNADAYTHRSGRTGRAGRKGTSVLLISKAALRRTQQLLERARIKPVLAPVPTKAMIEKAQDERLLSELSAEGGEVSERIRQQVARIVDSGHAEVALSRLLSQIQIKQGEPRQIAPVAVRQERLKKHQNTRAGSAFPRAQASTFKRDKPYAGARKDADWVPFHVSCGKAHGADARRLVAMLCRRGNIRGSDIGAIRVSTTSSQVQVSKTVARSFAEATRGVDPRNPRVNVSVLEPRAERAGKNRQPQREA